jgi:asparagine synthetase B (glutamine-hydrolysing)
VACLPSASGIPEKGNCLQPVIVLGEDIILCRFTDRYCLLHGTKSHSETFPGQNTSAPHALAECISYNYPLDLKNTWIDQVKRVQAGEYVLVDGKGLEFHRYWKRDLTSAFRGSIEEAKAETLRLMRVIRKSLLRSDVPVAVL